MEAASAEVSMMESLTNNNRIAARFTSGLGILYLNFCCLILLFYFFKKTAGAFLLKFFSIFFNILIGILCCCCKKSKNTKVAEEEARLKEMEDKGIDS